MAKTTKNGPVNHDPMAAAKNSGKKTVVRQKPLRTVKLGLIGLGPRGETLTAALREITDIEICAICESLNVHASAGLVCFSQISQIFIIRL